MAKLKEGGRPAAAQADAERCYLPPMASSEASVFPLPVLPDPSSLPAGSSLTALSDSPLIFTVDGFVSAPEIARFMEQAHGRMRRANVGAQASPATSSQLQGGL